MIGTWLQIRINCVECSYKNDKRIWIIKSTLTDDWQAKYDEHFVMTTPKNTLQKWLHRLLLYIYYESLDVIDEVFNELCDLYPTEKWILAVKHVALGDHKKEKEHNWPLALEHYEKALAIWFEHMNDGELNPDYDIVRLYLKIGIGCQDPVIALKNYNLAIAHSQLALEKVNTSYEQYMLQRWVIDGYDMKKAVCTDDNDRKECRLAMIKYKELQIEALTQMQSATTTGNYSNHLRREQVELADLYESVGKYNEATAVYEKALETELKR
ncbi:unnamed protein product, partial [Rotaria sp. Silwood1]